MKVNRQDKTQSFVPFQIVIDVESQDEADMLYGLGNYSHSVAGAILQIKHIEAGPASRRKRMDFTMLYNFFHSFFEALQS